MLWGFFLSALLWLVIFALAASFRWLMSGKAV